MLGIACACAVLLAGFLIGATSIGGVLVVPALTRLQGMDLPTAIAASACGFGLAALGMLCMRRLRPGARAGAGEDARLGEGAPEPWLQGAALAGAAGGALLVHAVSARALLLGVVVILLFAGARGLLQGRRTSLAGAAADRARPLSPPALVLIGLSVGAGSALTGTGGPVLLTPMLLLLGQQPVRVLATAQAVQLPVAVAATAVHWRAGTLDWSLAALIGALVFAGSLAGTRAVRNLHVELLQRMVSLLLLVVGAWYAVLALQ
jgi:uncharacterized membrane protein YfcA